MQLDAPTTISLAAFLLSTISFIVTFVRWRRDRLDRYRPVLIFEYGHSDGWAVRNLGNGPAMNVTFALKKGDIESAKGNWIERRRLPPIASGGVFKLVWTDHDNHHGFGATYEDIIQTKFTTTCGNDVNRVSPGHIAEIASGESVAHWE